MRAIVAALVFLASAAAAAESAGDTAALKRLDLKRENIVVFYPKDGSMAVGAAPAWTADYRDAGVYVDVPFSLALGHGAPKVTLACDSGGSNDPRCRLLTNVDDADSVIFESPGNRFVFRESGEIEVSGATDFMYDHRRLFRFDGTKWNEVAQPFRYVGVEGRAKAPIELTLARAGAGSSEARVLVTTVPKGSPLTILMNASTGDDENGQNADYLVKTREGLVGWAHIAQHPDGTSDVDGLKYSGD